jgi:hypothetical protein
MLKSSLHPLMRKGYDIIWHDCPRFPHEGAHREYAVGTCQKYGADMVLVVDADEVWDVDILDNALTVASKGNFHSYRIGMRHFFRSTKWVCDDAAMPTRIVKPNIPGNSEEYISGKVFHFGYAQTPKVIFYKQDIHGHKAEWRPGWFENIFMPWRPGMGDVHPTSVNYWNPVEYIDDEQGTLEYLIGDHPFCNMEVIS